MGWGGIDSSQFLLTAALSASPRAGSSPAKTYSRCDAADEADSSRRNDAARPLSCLMHHILLPSPSLRAPLSSPPSFRRPPPSGGLAQRLGDGTGSGAGVRGTNEDMTQSVDLWMQEPLLLMLRSNGLFLHSLERLLEL